MYNKIIHKIKENVNKYGKEKIEIRTSKPRYTMNKI